MMNTAQIVSSIIAIFAGFTLYQLYRTAQYCDGNLDKFDERKLKSGMALMAMTIIAQLYAGIGDTPLAFIWLKGVSIFYIFNERAYMRTLDKYR